MAYKADLVARIKGAIRAGLGLKFIAHRTGIPIDTLKAWSREYVRGGIEPDEQIATAIDDVLLGRFSGRGSES